MDELVPFGRDIAQSVLPTYHVYGARLHPHRARIKSTTCKTFPYGADPRQNLDVYYPPSSSPRPGDAGDAGAARSILLFLYGGGLVSGSKTSPLVDDGLVYANLGHFFAEQRGYLVVIPNYRLVPQARFPSGGEDVALVVDWLVTHLDGELESGGRRDLFIMGNSAGGVHLSTYLWSPQFAASRRRVLEQDANTASLSLTAVVLLSVPFHFHAADPSRNAVLTAYFGDRREEDCPLGLLGNAGQTTDSDRLARVQFLVLTASLDPDDEILGPNRDWVEAWQARGAPASSNLHVGVVHGHNHISPVLSLGTGDAREEKWGREVDAFFQSAKRQPAATAGTASIAALTDHDR